LRLTVTFRGWREAIVVGGVDRHVDRPIRRIECSWGRNGVFCDIHAGRGARAMGRTTHNPPVVGSSPTRPT